jgi:serine/threonine protein kinase
MQPPLLFLTPQQQQGASCAVFRGHVYGVPVAVKVLKDSAVEWEAKQYAAEMDLLIAASHGNICRLLAFSTDGPSKCLVLQLCNGGALNDRLACKAPAAGRAPLQALPWEHRVRIALGILRALAYLHAMPMIHRDLKTANVLLDEAGEAKVTNR